MLDPTSSSGDRPPRRTQAQRSAETRSRVIQAAIECIAAHGFRNTTTSRICERAGVTWGAIQHQFGDKNAIIFAVVDQALQELVTELGRVPMDLPVRERLRAFMRRAWKAYSRPSYRVLLEIVLNLRNDSGLDRPGAPGVSDLMRALVSAWDRTFADVAVSEMGNTTARRLFMASLAGLALEVTLRRRNVRCDSELAALEDTLLRLLVGVEYPSL
jgi:AcrR family transcriptional regulator